MPCNLTDVKIFIVFIFIFKGIIYLFMRDTQRETETQAEAKAGSMRGAQCGI